MKDFPILIEINSLHLRMIDHQQNIITHQQRLVHLDRKQAQIASEQHQLQEEIVALQTQITQREQQLERGEKKLKNTQAHQHQITNQAQLRAQEKELADLSHEIAATQDALFTLWEQEEQLHTLAQEKTHFLAGLPATRVEIATEVDEAIQQENTQLAQFRQRIEALLRELTGPHGPEIQQLLQQFSRSSFICFVQNLACGHCRLQVTKHFQQQLERGQVWERCAHCGRLFVSNGLHS